MGNDIWLETGGFEMKDIHDKHKVMDYETHRIE